MEYYFQKFFELEKEFDKTIHDYPLFKEMIDDIEKNDIKEINELIEKNDEYYIKRAIDKLERLIDYIKKTSDSINKEYERFDLLAKDWSKKELLSVSDKELDIINDKVNKANELILKHNLKDIKEANIIMEELLKIQ